jgi:glucose/arabinose dehydrogenase
VIRVNPDTGAAVPGNPMFSSRDGARNRVVAYGLRNPFRITVRPGTSEVWVGDVGWEGFEEINRVSKTFATAPDFGWPCLEGDAPQPAWFDNGITMCTSLYQSHAAAHPYLSYSHKAEIVAGDGCTNNNESAITGLAFYTGASYPAAYRGSLFFTDIERSCIWRLPRGANGLPTAKPVLFRTGTPNPISLKAGPGGDIFYFDHIGGAMHRIRYTG